MTTAVSTRQVVIEVVIEEDRISVIPPELVHVEQGGTVRWVSPTLTPFQIVFADPFFEHTIGSRYNGRELVAANIGRYKYSIVLDHDRNVRLDPEIEVDPPPRNGGG
jgi:hypothetical protein